MDRKEPHADSILKENGIYVKGVVISNGATKVTKKDGNPLVIVNHELALEPGVVVLQQFFDPKEVKTVKVEGDQVLEYPKFAKYKSLLIRAEKIEEKRGQSIASSWKLVG